MQVGHIVGGCAPRWTWPPVEADPQGVFIPLEYLVRLDIVRQLFEALLVPLFDFSHQLEGGGNVLEALLPGGFGEVRIHFSPFVPLARGGVQQVVHGARHGIAVQALEPQLGVLLFVPSGFVEDIADLLIPVLARLGGIEGVLVAAWLSPAKAAIRLASVPAPFESIPSSFRIK